MIASTSTDTTMSLAVMTQNLRGYLREHPRVTRPGGLLAFLGIELGSPGPEGLTLICQALLHMERHGEVELKKSGSTYDGVRLRNRQRHAKTRKAASDQEEAAVPTDIQYSEDDPLHVVLTKALYALRAAVGPTGIAVGVAIYKVLEDMGLPKERVSNITEYLRKMELYNSKLVGPHLPRLTVDMEVAEFTAEMVEQVRAMRKAGSEPRADAQPTDADSQPADTGSQEVDVDANATKVNDASPNTGDPLDLLEAELKARNRTLDVLGQQNGEYLARIRELEADVERLTAELQEARARIVQLQGEDARLTERVNRLVAKYTTGPADGK